MPVGISGLEASVASCLVHMGDREIQRAHYCILPNVLRSLHRSSSFHMSAISYACFLCYVQCNFSCKREEMEGIWLLYLGSGCKMFQSCYHNLKWISIFILFPNIASAYNSDNFTFSSLFYWFKNIKLILQSLSFFFKFFYFF